MYRKMNEQKLPLLEYAGEIIFRKITLFTVHKA